MRKLYILVAVLVLLAVTAVPALAKWSWCSTDPEVKLPGQQGSIYIWVDVPEEYAGQSVSLHLTVPDGSEVISHVGEVAVVTEIDRSLPAKSHVIKARVSAGSAVQLRAFHDQEALKTYIFESGAGKATWTW